VNWRSGIIIRFLLKRSCPNKSFQEYGVKPTDKQIDEIRNLIEGPVTANVPLSRFTSFKIGGPADLVAEPRDTEDLKKLIRYLDEKQLARIVLGEGTNVLFNDRGFRGIIIRTASLDLIEIHRNGSDFCKVVIGAGAPLPTALAKSCRLGLSGMEPLWGIPGSFGGAIVTNAGAGDISIGDLLECVNLVTETGQDISIPKDDLRFAYRKMYLPSGTTVIGGVLRLKRSDKESIRNELDLSKSGRRGKQPVGPSAGCVFKNPAPDNPAGAIIDRLGFKGVRVGDAQVSPIHANFIVNRGKATAADVLELIDRIRSRAHEKENVNLELEICVVGEGGTND